MAHDLKFCISLQGTKAKAIIVNKSFDRNKSLFLKLKSDNYIKGCQIKQLKVLCCFYMK